MSTKSPAPPLSSESFATTHAKSPGDRTPETLEGKFDVEGLKEDAVATEPEIPEEEECSPSFPDRVVVSTEGFGVVASTDPPHKDGSAKSPAASAGARIAASSPRSADTSTANEELEWTAEEISEAVQRLRDAFADVQRKTLEQDGLDDMILERSREGVRLLGELEQSLEAEREENARLEAEDAELTERLEEYNCLREMLVGTWEQMELLREKFEKLGMPPDEDDQPSVIERRHARCSEHQNNGGKSEEAGAFEFISI